MNKFVNIWTIIFFLLSLPLGFAVGYAGSYEILQFKFPDETWEYYPYIFNGFALVFFILGAMKASRRWMGMFIAKQTKKFVWSAPISKERKSRIAVYSGLEIIILVALGMYYLDVNPMAVYVALVLFIIAFEHLLHTFLGLAKNWFRVGITKNAVVSTDREVKVMYFSGLRKISLHQQSLYFEYIKNLTLHIPVNSIKEENFAAFRTALKEQLNEDKVYLNQAFKDQ